MDATTASIIRRLAEYLEETHEEAGEMNKNEFGVSHYGDGEAGCSYCKAIAEAREMLGMFPHLKKAGASSRQR